MTDYYYSNVFLCPRGLAHAQTRHTGDVEAESNNNQALLEIKSLFVAFASYRSASRQKLPIDIYYIYQILVYIASEGKNNLKSFVYSN